MTRKTTLRGSIVAILMTLAMLLSAAPAFAAGGPPAGRGGGGGKGGGQGGGGGETTVPNNLSVPAIFIGTGGPTLNLTCSPTATPPTGTPLTNYPIDSDAYYFVQGIHKWQASCYAGADYASASAYASWGDNLAGDAALKTGSPIRVEMGLLQGSYDTTASAVVPTVVGTGYVVDKLDPNALDRDSAYGILAQQTDGVWGPATDSVDMTFPETRVWVEGATLTLTDSAGNVTNLDPTAEINATGRVVYGYNLRINTAGSYTLKFTVPKSITITGENRGSATVDPVTGATTISLPITVTGGGGSGGGGGRP